MLSTQFVSPARPPGRAQAAPAGHPTRSASLVCKHRTIVQRRAHSSFHTRASTAQNRALLRHRPGRTRRPEADHPVVVSTVTLVTPTDAHATQPSRGRRDRHDRRDRRSVSRAHRDHTTLTKAVRAVTTVVRAVTSPCAP
jgi:hypothetical protein